MHFKVSATDDSGVWISGSISPGPCWAYSTGLRCRDRNLHEEGSRTIVTFVSPEPSQVVHFPSNAVHTTLSPATESYHPMLQTHTFGNNVCTATWAKTSRSHTCSLFITTCRAVSMTDDLVDVKTKLLLLNDTFALVFMRTVYKSSEGAVHTGEDTVYPDGHASAQYFNVVELSSLLKN